MPVTTRAIPNAYQDSVKLMRVASDAVDRHWLDEAQAVMATDENKAMVVDAGLAEAADLADLGPNDLLLAVEAADAADAERAVEAMEGAIRGASGTGGESGDAVAIPPKSVASAVRELPDANLALVSVPGEYAAREAWKALHEGLHVHVFSDNVDLAEERALKAHAEGTGQLVMGPDCGTAILNGVPLGFANAVDRGGIGLVAAAGTGLQEVTSLIDRAGAGVSQAIGTGGRDLSAEVGGLTMLGGFERLRGDDATDVIVLLSKPPDEATLGPLLDAVEAGEKPVVVGFIGADEDPIEAAGATAATTLAEAARRAVETAPDGVARPVGFDDGVDGFASDDDAAAIADTLGDPGGRTDVRGVYTGGTFATEAVTLLAGQLDGIGSNVSAGGELEDPLSPTGHAVVDLGADTFTRGRPHPMIDPSLRTDQLRSALAADEVLVVLLDVVLGYGAHEDPAGPVADAVREAGSDGWPAVVSSVCGTRGDPQDWPDQVATLVDAGVTVTETNAAAAALAGELWAAAGAPKGGGR